MRRVVVNAGPQGMRGPAPAQPAAGRSQTTPGRVGWPVPRGLRARMEAAFGADFSTVTVHEGEEPAAVGALALTSGEAITLRPGLGADTADGAQVLGHELAHVLQQREGRVGGTGLTEDPALEAEADEAGQRAARGEPVSAASRGPGPGAATQGPVAPDVAQPMRYASSIHGMSQILDGLGVAASPRQATQIESDLQTGSLGEVARAEAPPLREPAGLAIEEPLERERDVMGSRAARGA